MSGRLGAPVIDELRLCYVAEPSSLEELSAVELGASVMISPFILYRVGGDRFQFQFVVCEGDIGNRKEVAYLKYGRYSAADSPYVYYRLSNHVLYDVARLREVLMLPEMLGMVFNNFTAIDIAIDYKKNISSIVKRMMRNDRIKTIINGKVWKERKTIIPGVTFDYSTSLSRLHCPTITLRQAKAAKNKEKGVTIQCYDKKAEIEFSSDKGYILDYYDSPVHLFRLEVRLHYQELQDYCRREGVAQSIEYLFDPAFLAGAFYYHLGSVLRFTLGRKKLDWQEIIERNGKV